MKNDKDTMLRDSKIQALKQLRRMMEDLMLEDKQDVEQIIPKSMQKVTVAASDEKSLKQGLKKAEDILDAKHTDLVTDMEPLEEDDMYDDEDLDEDME